jgi:DNA excision repair protein ERCC-4
MHAVIRFPQRIPNHSLTRIQKLEGHSMRIGIPSSPYFTAEVFEELKKNHEEPDPFTDVKIGLDLSETPGTKQYNQALQEFLRSVPGVSTKNIHNLMLEWENVQPISMVPEGQLMEVVGPEAGWQIWGFFNKKLY